MTAAQQVRPPNITLSPKSRERQRGREAEKQREAHRESKTQRESAIQYNENVAHCSKTEINESLEIRTSVINTRPSQRFEKNFEKNKEQ